MEKRFKFRYVNELTGVFVLSVLAVVIAGVLFSGLSQRWFSRTYAFDVLLPEKGSFGLSRGNQVFILGVSAGAVSDIHVDDDGRITAHVKIRAEFERFVREDSVASLKKVFGVAGDSFLEITRGTGPRLPAREAVIRCQSSEELSSILEKSLTELRDELLPVVKKAGATLDVWVGLGTDLKQTQAQLHQLVTRLDGLAAGLEKGEGTAGKLLTDNALAENAQKALGQANEALASLRELMTNAQVVTKNAERSSERLPEITDALADEAKHLPGLVEQTQVTMRELERTIEAMQRHWLIRKYVNKTNPPPLRPFPLSDERPQPPPLGLRSPRDSDH